MPREWLAQEEDAGARPGSGHSSQQGPERDHSPEGHAGGWQRGGGEPSPHLHAGGLRCPAGLGWEKACWPLSLPCRARPCLGERGEGLGSVVSLFADQKWPICLCLCSLPMMLFPAGAGLVCAAPGNGGDGFDRVRCKVLLWCSGQVSREGTGWSRMAPIRAVKAVLCAPTNSPASNTQLLWAGRPGSLATCREQQHVLPGENYLSHTLSWGASLISGPKSVWPCGWWDLQR